MQFLTVIKEINDASIAEAARIIQNRGLVGFPTETVYGLGANAFDETALQSVFDAKGRPADNPLIVHVAQIADVYEIAREIPAMALLLMEKFWPGPLSILLKKKDCIPAKATAGLDTVAVRMPANQGALDLIKACGLPVAAPSANLSGLPSPTRAIHVFRDMSGKIPLILDGGPCLIGVESTVVDMSGGSPAILRPGAVTAEMIRDVCGSCGVSPGVLGRLSDGETALSPGMKHRHYSPENSRVLILDGDGDALAEYFRGLKWKKTHKCAALVMDSIALKIGGIEGFDVYPMGDENAYASRLFDVLRTLDETGCDVIYCQSVEEKGIGMALMNRLLRAANFQRERVL